MKKICLLPLLIALHYVCYAQFSSPIPISNINSATTSPSCVFAADLDADGDKDVLGTSSNDDKVAWYENLGNGQFSSQKLISVNGDFPTAVFAQDMDLDGDLDAICASSLDGAITWYPNSGNGAFGTGNTITNLALGVNSAWSSDFDGDGDFDIVSITEDVGSMVAWYENTGAGIFGPQQIISTAIDNGKDLFTADLDNDGDEDILSASSNDNKIAWYENLGGGIFGSQVIVTTNAIGAISVYSADMDGDSDMDVLSASVDDDKISWYENLGSGVFGTQQVVAILTTGGGSIYSCDMDGDTDIDILASSFEDKIVWYPNLGTGTFGGGITISTKVIQPKSVIAADLDGDNLPEVISASSDDNKTAFYKNLGGTFGPQYLLSTQTAGAWNVKSGDLDNDGDFDIVVASPWASKIGWFENLSNGNFGAQNVLVDSIGGIQAVCLSDLDMDGDLDIISGDPVDGSIIWFKNYGSGNFSNAIIIDNYSITITGIVCGDLNGDTTPDIVALGGAGGGTAKWYPNAGSGTFGAPQSLGTGNALSATIADFDNDGDNDMATGQTSIKLYENLGTGTFTSSTLDTPTPNALSVHAADLDQDGLLDLLYAFNNQIRWKKNNGGLSFAAPIAIPNTIADARNLITADIDLDGDLDIIATASGGLGFPKHALYENLGGGIFGTEQIICDTLDGHGIAVFDAEPDGDPDLVYAAYIESNVGWFQNYTITQNLIEGKVFVDLNQNALLDSSDIGTNLIAVFSTPASDFTYTYANGDYFMMFSDTMGTYLIQPENIPYWSIVTDSLTYTITLDSSNSFVDSVNFGIYPDTLIDAISPNLVSAFPTCNQQINYYLHFSNQGTTIPSGFVKLTLDNDIIFLSSAIPVDSITGQDIYWSFDSLMYFDSEMITIQVQMPDFTFMGDTLTSYLEVAVLDTNGVVSYSNYDVLNEVLVCAYDPNDKISDPAGFGSLGYVPVSTTEIEYTIRFQNTGTDTAQTVVIKDQLDPNLNWGSLTPLAASNAVQITVDQFGEVIFTFTDIFLPDSNVNEPASQGFIKYRIALDTGLSAGTSISNTAKIYFDQNPAVITNTKVNTLYDCNYILQAGNYTTETCYNNPVSGVIPFDHSTIQINWLITDIDSATGPNFLWQADTSGVFEQLISATTYFCSQDTLIPLTIFGPVSLNLIPAIQICENDSTLIFGNYQTNATIYYDTLVTNNGCDSIIAQELIVLPAIPTNNLANIAICLGQSVLIFDQLQSISGVYYDTLQTINGCDSILSKQLDVLPLPAVNFNTLAPDTLCSNSETIVLSASPAGGVYSGAGVTTNQFDPAMAGNGPHYLYYDYTDGNGCSAKDSAWIFVENCLGIADENPYAISVYPNPFIDFTTIVFGQELQGNHSVLIYDLLGKIVYSNDQVKGSKLNIQRGIMTTGIYVLTIIDTEHRTEIYSAKLIVK